ncbi:MAG: VOC family protein [Rhodospirillaceae bacterium]|nr:VOC family protein [Rhodospirillaceae bacterium]
MARAASLIVVGALALAGPALAQTAADTEVKSLIPPSTTPRPPAVFQPGQALAPMARATIFVRDIDASLKLYRDILGLKPMFDNHWKGKGINDIMGTSGKELRATVLMAGDSVVGNIGIYQLYNEKGTPPPPARGSDTRIGDVAVIFPTNDIWGLTKKIQDAGYEMISPPVVLIERPGMKQQPLEMMFRDPDGVLVNLVQAGVPN